MPINPELMRVDYSGLGRIGQSIGRGIMQRKQNQVEGLAGRALMGQPDAMEELMSVNPMMGAKVQQQLDQQSAQQSQAAMQREQADFDRAVKESEIIAGYGERLSRFSSYDDARAEHERLMRTDRLYQMLNKGGELEDGSSVPDAGDFTEDDFLSARAQFGSGYGDMDIKDVRSAYANSPQVKTYIEVKTKMQEINDLLSRGTPAGDNAALKILAKMVDSGVVTDSDFNQLANRNPDNAAAISNLLDYVVSGKVSDEARIALRQVGGDLFKQKEAEAMALQERMMPNLGQHSPEVVFDSTGLFSGPTEVPEPEAPQQPQSLTWTDPETGKPYTFPSGEALQKFLADRGGQ